MKEYKRREFLGFAAAGLALAGCGKKVNIDAEIEAVRKADSDWLKTMLEKDIDHLLTYYDDDAIWLLPNMPILRGKDAIRNNWTNWFKTSDSSLSWKPIKVEVSKSGDLAYSFGTYDIQYKVIEN